MAHAALEIVGLIIFQDELRARPGRRVSLS